MAENAQIMDSGEIIVPTPSGDTLRFKDFTELEEWARQERETWKPLYESRQKLRYSGEVIVTPHWSFFNNLSAVTGDAVRGPTQTQTQRRQQVLEMLKSIVSGEFPTSESVEGQRILTAFNRDPLLAIGHLAWGKLGGDVEARHNPNLLAFVKLMVDSRLDQRLGIDDLTVQQESLDKLRQRWVGRFSAMEQQQKATLEASEESHQQARKASADALRQVRSMHRDCEASLQQTQAAYTTQMQMRASELYWKERKDICETKAGAALTKFFWGTAIGIAALAAVFWAIGEYLHLEGAFGTSHFFIYGVPSLFVIWILRLFYSEYRSREELAADADERIAMVKTFKALEVEGKASDAERAIILHTLFRPYKGSVDDGVPNPVWESILKSVGGSRS